MAFGNRWQSIRKGSDPFTDLLFNALLGFTYLFLIAIMFMNPVAKKGIIDPKAEYIITIGWPDNNPDDIDTWVEDPNGNVIWFRNREAGLIHLDRDDRGIVNDTIVINGTEIQNPLNQEVVTIRGIVPGEYVVNLHYYATETNKPVKATVKVAKVNPALEIVYYGDTVLDEKGDEKTAVRFVIDKSGRVDQISHIFKSLVIF
ncbi:MAG: hypothetical protein O7B81_10140 [Gammaproteobacteria bacterium]|nr:hypothetical protein [Gammaproteobacteria bacterium]MCZ6774179.1 hypothetical protein [Pseudomonadota bacterium]MCZ6893143.1 hypothetical protein [Gammaproteobacteria bacterium]